MEFIVETPAAMAKAKVVPSASLKVYLRKYQNVFRLRKFHSLFIIWKQTRLISSLIKEHLNHDIFGKKLVAVYEVVKN